MRPENVKTLKKQNQDLQNKFEEGMYVCAVCVCVCVCVCACACACVQCVGTCVCVQVCVCLCMSELWSSTVWDSIIQGTVMVSFIPISSSASLPLF